MTATSSDSAPTSVNPSASATSPTNDDDDAESSETAESEDTFKLDVEAGETDGPPDPPTGCVGAGSMMGNGEIEFSYAWVANSPEKTVSKIDTITGTEIARYVTGPEDQAEPSRTTVNLYGDVAVANRGEEDGGAGGVTKFAARVADCRDRNGNGSIETSSGPSDVLAWGEDECMIWNTAIPSDDFEHGPRPLAWEGVVDDEGCADPNPRLWMGWYEFDTQTAKFHRIEGDSGLILDTIEEPWNELAFGPYGGAVDQDGDFWVIGWQQGPLIRIDAETLALERIEMPAPPAPDMFWAYGMALDQRGNPWIATGGAAANYDVASGQWTFLSTGNTSMRGVVVDQEDRAWFAVDNTGEIGGCGLALIDVETRTVVAPALPVAGCITPVGVSIDVEGFVWVVDEAADAAFKINPDSMSTVLRVDDLNAPYTYSDMTGAALSLVAGTPAG